MAMGSTAPQGRWKMAQLRWGGTGCSEPPHMGQRKAGGMAAPPGMRLPSTQTEIMFWPFLESNV